MIKRTFLIFSIFFLLANESFASITHDGVDDSWSCGTADIWAETGAKSAYLRINVSALPSAAANAKFIFKEDLGAVDFRVRDSGALQFSVDGDTGLVVRGTAS